MSKRTRTTSDRATDRMLWALLRLSVRDAETQLRYGRVPGSARAVRPGHSGPASHVRMVLGRDRVRGRSRSAISPMIQDRMGPIPSTYTEKHAPRQHPEEQPGPPRAGKAERPGADPRAVRVTRLPRESEV